MVRPSFGPKIVDAPMYSCSAYSSDVARYDAYSLASPTISVRPCAPTAACSAAPCAMLISTGTPTTPNESIRAKVTGSSGANASGGAVFRVIRTGKRSESSAGNLSPCPSIGVRFRPSRQPNR